MSKKVVVLVGLLIVIIVAVSVTLYMKKQPYSDNPKKWLEKKNGGIIEINVDKVTKGEGYLDVNGQQYRSSDISTVFRYEGFYNGEPFFDTYKDTENRVFMRITNNIQPSDGIIDGFIVVMIENDKPIFNIFIDNDWKNRVVPTNIMYGLENKIERLDFEEIREGIFYAKFEIDEGFFDNFKFHTEAVLVGDFSQKKIENEDNDITMMIIQ